MKKIFLPTIQHTGTRFLHFTIAYAVQPYYYRLAIGFDHPLVVNPYCYVLDKEDGEVKRFQVKSFDELIQCIEFRFAKLIVTPPHQFVAQITTHFGSGVGSFIPFPIQEQLMDIYPTIITVRDPLAALITREGRTSADEHSYIVNGFVELAASEKEFFCLPIDLYPSGRDLDHWQLLVAMFQYLEIEADENYIKAAAATWANYGATQKDKSLSQRIKDYALTLKSAYGRRELGVIIKAMPKTYAYLKSKEQLIRPFLEKQGYRDLIWWEK